MKRYCISTSPILGECVQIWRKPLASSNKFRLKRAFSPMAQYCLFCEERNNTDMTTIQDFKLASFEKKCDVVTTQSNYLMTRTLGNCKIYLYHTGKFFIEVYYAPVYKKVLAINGFNDADSLRPYADKVSLTGLGIEDDKKVA